MSETKIPSHYVESIGKFVSTELSGAQQAFVLASFPPNFDAAIRAGGWHPTSLVHPIFRALVQSVDNDEARAQAVLTDLGRSVARDGTNSMLRLLVRVMTPSVMAKQLSRLWKFYHRGGDAAGEVVGDRCFVARCWGVSGYEHVGPIAAGWLGFALAGMGKKLVEQTCTGWSVKTPAPESVSFRFVWE